MKRLVSAACIVGISAVPHIWADDYRNLVGSIDIGPREDIEFLVGLSETDFPDYGKSAYLTIVDFGGCAIDRNYATDFVSRVIRDEDQPRQVHSFEVGCLAKPDGRRVVAVLQNENAASYRNHRVFVYDLGVFEKADAASKRCDFGEASYDHAKIEITALGDAEGFLILTSHASTGEGTAAVFDPACSPVLSSTWITNRLIQRDNSRAFVTVEPIPRESNECGFLVRRLGTANHIVARESCSDCTPNYESVDLMSNESVEAMRRMVHRSYSIDFSTPPLADNPH